MKVSFQDVLKMKQVYMPEDMHEKILYTHKRVKKVNLLGIVNYNHIQRGLSLIKSASTVYNRSKARNIRSRQVRNHIGKNLFCTKKHQKQSIQQQRAHNQGAHKNHLDSYV